MKRVVFSWAIICLVVGGFVSVSRAQVLTPPGYYAAPVTLAWNPANDPSIRGYAVYYGLTNQPATNRIDTGMNTAATLFELLANVTYRLYAVSYNAQGVESVPSNAVLVKQAAIARLKVAQQANGSMKLTFSAAPGTASRVQYTSKPTGAAWQTLGTTTNDANGNGTMIDPTVKQPSRFYRIAVP
jgi:hypothetical protein